MDACERLYSVDSVSSMSVLFPKAGATALKSSHACRNKQGMTVWGMAKALWQPLAAADTFL